MKRIYSLQGQSVGKGSGPRPGEEQMGEGGQHASSEAACLAGGLMVIPLPLT